MFSIAGCTIIRNFALLTNSRLADDPGEAKKEHHTPDIEQTSHLNESKIC